MATASCKSCKADVQICLRARCPARKRHIENEGARCASHSTVSRQQAFHERVMEAESGPQGPQYVRMHAVPNPCSRARKIKCISTRTSRTYTCSYLYIQPAPAPLHQRTTPSSPPLTNSPGEPCCGGRGRHETPHTSPVSCIVETAARAPTSHTLIVLSAELDNEVSAMLIHDKTETAAATYPESARRPSGEISVLSTQEECPDNVATAPEPGFPEGEYRTSCSVRRLSSDAETSSCDGITFN